MSQQGAKGFLGMTAERPGREQTQRGTAFLGEFDALREELNTAMLAISGNSLAALERSLWRQEVLCVSLQRLSQSLDPESMESPLMARIGKANAALHHLNESYTSLVQQSSHSAGLLHNLCRSYKDAASPMLESSSPRAAWSCEV
jgi:hypothetical protein